MTNDEQETMSASDFDRRHSFGIRQSVPRRSATDWSGASARGTLRVTGDPILALSLGLEERDVGGL